MNEMKAVSKACCEDGKGNREQQQWSADFLRILSLVPGKGCLRVSSHFGGCSFLKPSVGKIFLLRINRGVCET